MVETKRSNRKKRKTSPATSNTNTNISSTTTSTTHNKTCTPVPKSQPNNTTSPTTPNPTPTPTQHTLIITSEKQRGVYECDYCKSDISQTPRIRCATCPDFDLCLECFATTDVSAIAQGIRAGLNAKAAVNALNGNGNGNVNVDDDADVNNVSGVVDKKKKKKRDGDGVILEDGEGRLIHDETHGYRVSDSTRFVMFPSVRGVSSLVKYQQAVQAQIQADVGMERLNSAGSKSASGGASAGLGEKTATSTKRGVFVDVTERERKDKETKNAPNTNTESEAATKDKEGGTTTTSSKAPNTPTSSSKPTPTNDTKILPNGDELVVTDDPATMWTAEEDLRLLHGIKTCGLGNWADIAEVVSGNSSTNLKSAKRCMERYFDDFLNRYGCILPEYTLVEKKEDGSGGIGGGGVSGSVNGTTVNSVLLDTPLKALQEDVGGFNSSRKRNRVSQRVIQQENRNNALSDLNINAMYDVVPTSSLMDMEQAWPDAYVPPIGVKMGDEVARDYTYEAEQAYFKLVSNASSKAEGEKIRQEWIEKHKNDPFVAKVLPPRVDDMNELPGAELAGYMQRRGDFDVEWENDAEAMLAEMDFSATDSKEERELKIRVIEIYNSKLDEREKRKKFLKDYGLLDYRKMQAEDQSRPSDERDLVNRMRLFARFHSPQQHKEFINNIIEAKRLRKEIARLQMYRRMGIRSMAEAERFELDRTRREAHKQAFAKSQTGEKATPSGNDVDAGSLSPTEGMDSGYLKQYKSNSDRKSRKSTNRTQQASSSLHSDVMNQGRNAEETNVHAPGGQPLRTDTQVTTANAENEANTSTEGNTETPMDIDENSFRIKEYPGYDLLSSKEVMLCENLKLLPEYYLEAKKTLIRESFHRGMLEMEGTNSNHQSIAMIDVTKRKDVVEFVMKSGWV